MASKDLDQARCSISRALGMVGETWSMLILRDLAQGYSKYDEFRKSLGISPGILSKRLNELCDAALVKKELYQENPPRYAYKLTERGQDFLPVIAALLVFGNKHASPAGIDTQMFDKETLKSIKPIVVDANTKQPLDFENILFGGGPANSEKKIASLKRRNLPLGDSVSPPEKVG